MGCVAIGSIFALPVLPQLIARVRLDLRRRHAALRVLARENFPLRMTGTVIGGTRWPAASAWRWGSRRRPHLRRARKLHVALCRLMSDGARRLPDRHDLQAVPEGRARAGSRADVSVARRAPDLQRPAMTPRPTMPTSSIAHVDGSGTAEPYVRLLMLRVSDPEFAQQHRGEGAVAARGEQIWRRIDAKAGCRARIRERRTVGKRERDGAAGEGPIIH